MESTDEIFKKILIVSSWAPPSIGGPQNLYNLFSQFPDNSYCLLTSYYGIDNYSAKKGTWLKGKYYFYDKPKLSGPFKSQSDEITISIGRERINKLKLLVKRLNFLKILLGPFIIFIQIFWIIKEGTKVIKKENIDIILGISDFGPALIGTYFLHKISKKPYLLHLYDIYYGNFFPFPGGVLAKIFEKKLFKNAQRIIVTNDGTKEFYEKRYGKNFAKIEIIYNSVFPENYLKLQTPYKPKEPYTIVYTGRIYWPQIKSLKNLIRAVDEIKDIKINLDFYVPQPPEYIKSLGFDLNKINLKSAPPEKMPEIQSKADILFLPLSWHTKSPQIIETATPGKLSDYLISGRPILIHAPSWTFLVKYAKENNFALVVDEENKEKLKEAIRQLIADKKLAEMLIKNAQKTFFKNHNAYENKIKLVKIFNGIKLEKN